MYSGLKTAGLDGLIGSLILILGFFFVFWFFLPAPCLASEALLSL